MMCSVYLSIIYSVDQCLGEWVMFHSKGNSNWGWQRGVFLLYIICTGRKSPTKDPQKTAVIWHLSLTPIISSTLLLHGPRWTWNHLDPNSKWVQVGLPLLWQWQLHQPKHSFSSVNSAILCLLLAVVAFRWSKFIWPSSEWAQPLLRCTCPLYSASFVQSYLSRIPWAAAIAILADIAPPSSRTFLRYSCTCKSNWWPNKNCLPRFFTGREETSPVSSPSFLCLTPSQHKHSWLNAP